MYVIGFCNLLVYTHRDVHIILTNISEMSLTSLIFATYTVIEE